MVLRLRISDYLFQPGSPRQGPANANVADPTETRAQSGPNSGPNQSAPLTDLHPATFQDDLYSFQSGDMANWGFEMQPSSGFDFDLTQDLSSLLNTTWMP